MKLISFGEIIWDVYPDKATLGGAPLNFAVHSALQGCDTALISCVGDDEMGNRALCEIKKLGVDVSYVYVDRENETGKCTVSLNSEGIPTYTIAKVSAYDFIRLQEDMAEGYDALSFGTLALRYESNRKVLGDLISKYSFKEIFTDLNVRMPFCSAEAVKFCFENATTVKVSDEELPAVSEFLLNKTLEIEDFVKAVSQKYKNVSLILITKGGDGSVCYECKSGRFINCPAAPANVVSTVGAGDSFGATFLCEYMRCTDISSALFKASKVSAYVVSYKEAVPSGMSNFLKSI